MLTTVKGSDLRAMRLFAGLTTIKMAKAAGVKTRKTYENWEKEVGIPNVNQFFGMVNACGLDVDSFINFMKLREKQRSE